MTRWTCSLTTWAYDKKAVVNSAGKRRQRTYTHKEIDFFFIETGDHDLYLIPIQIVEGLTAIVLDKKYRKFKVN